MLELIAGYFTTGWQLAILLSVVCVTVASGLLSPIVVANRMAFFSDAVAHSTLAGVALGMLLGWGSPFALMAGSGVLVALLIATLRRRSPLGLDTLLGVAMAGTLAVGVLLYERARGYADLHSYLFGGKLSFLDWTDVAVLAGNALLAVGVVSLLGNRLALMAVSAPLAGARGVSTARHEYLLIVLLGLMVSLSVRAVGLLLVNSLLVLPAAASRSVARSYAGMCWGALLVAVVSGLVGLIGGDLLGVAPAPAIVVAAVACFAVAQGLRVLRA
ncbi:MAG: metal ABC transporter permease [Planctomycetes bacterium]|nr:metal ABC transporter permease [Planctomycetota bacterium]